VPEQSAGATPIEFTGPDGGRVRCLGELGADDESVAGPPFRDRALRVLDGAALPGGVREAVQRRVAGRFPPGTWEPFDRLDNEIRIGLLLAHRFGDGEYPPEMSRLVGYDIDAEEPFVLLGPYRGEQAHQLAGRLTLDQQRGFEVGLFRALRILEAARVVHGRLSPATVRWDEETASVQVVDFSRAVLVGEKRPAPGEPPWASPQQAAGGGIAAAGDDLWSAGALTFHVTTGRPMAGPGPAPDLSTRGAALQSLLAGVFAEAPAARPPAEQMLHRLRAPDPRLGRDGIDPRFLDGCRQFDEILAGKSPARMAANGSAPAGKDQRRKRRRHWPVWVSLALAVAVIAGVAIAVGAS
jgi:hypothetical protein